MRKRRAIKSKGNNQPARERILRYMRRKDYVPQRKEEILKRLAKKREDRTLFSDAIEDLIRDGDVVCSRRSCLVVTGDAGLVSGQIKFRQRGSALVIASPTADGKVPPPIFVRAEDTGVALHDDRVVVRLETPRKHPRHRRDPDERSGRVIRVLERARTTITGCLQKSRLFYFVVPDDPRIIPDIFVPAPASTKLKPPPEVGDKVVIKLHEWKQRHINPEGEIIEILGKDQEPGAELKAIFRNFNLDPDFPESVDREADQLPNRVRKSDLKGRTDLRDLFTFTIDPDDAKDFDDALSIETLPDGDFRVGIHIADVGAYVKPESSLDKEAKRRGNSTYLVGTVVPMLPQKLSNGICSLVENEDRLTKSVLVTFSRNLKIKGTEFTNSAIRSNKRLTYGQALAFLKEDNLKKIRAIPVPPAHQTGATGRALNSLSDKELKKLQQGVRDLWRVGSALRKRRMDAGSLDLEMEEVKIFVDNEYRAARIYKRDELKTGNRIPGPAIVVEMDSTTLILPDHEGEIDAFGNILIRPTE